MNKIRFAANPDCNFVFHMLSVSKCGYDNDYGAKYRHLYKEADLALLKENEELLTVRGGEHCGQLYHLMVCRPAWGRVSAKDYFLDLPGRIRWDDIREIYAPYEEVIRDVSAVMVKYYDDYIRDIWSGEQAKIREYIPPLANFFEENRFSERAEALVGCPLQRPSFTATLVTSVEYGAEAIDISEELDVFGIERSVTDAIYFMGHEFIIYLLFGALAGEEAFKTMDTWNITEGLAEYYLKKLMGDTRFFKAQQKYVAFFESCDEGLSAAELYRLALKR